MEVMRGVHLPTWGEAHQRAVGQRAVAVHLEVDWDGVQDGLQVLLLLQAAGGVGRRGRSCETHTETVVSSQSMVNNWRSNPRASQSAFHHKEGGKTPLLEETRTRSRLRRAS